MVRSFVAVLVLLAFSAGSASAVEPTDHGHIGGYAGINGSYAIDNSKGRVDNVTFSSGAASAWLGYRIDQILGLEAQGEWSNGLHKIDGWDITANLNWYPLQWWKPGYWLQPFLVTGAGFMSAKPTPKESTDFNGAFRLGGGIDFYVHEHWSIRFKGEWVTGIGRLSDVRYAPISLGAQYSW